MPGVVEARAERREPVAEPAAAEHAGDAAYCAVQGDLQAEAHGRQACRKPAAEVVAQAAADAGQGRGGDAGQEPGRSAWPKLARWIRASPNPAAAPRRCHSREANPGAESRVCQADRARGSFLPAGVGLVGRDRFRLLGRPCRSKRRACIVLLRAERPSNRPSPLSLSHVNRREIASAPTGRAFSLRMRSYRHREK